MNEETEKQESILPGAVAVGGGAISVIGNLMALLDARDLKSYTSGAKASA